MMIEFVQGSHDRLYDGFVARVFFFYRAVCSIYEDGCGPFQLAVCIHPHLHRARRLVGGWVAWAKSWLCRILIGQVHGATLESGLFFIANTNL